MERSYFTAAEARRMSDDDLLRRIAMWPVYGIATYNILIAEWERRERRS